MENNSRITPFKDSGGSSKRRAILISFFLLYVVALFVVYYYRGIPLSYRIPMAEKNYSMEQMINLIPFKTTADYIINSNRYNDIYLFLNLLVPVLLFVPAGLFSRAIWGEGFSKKSIAFLVSVVLFYFARVLLRIGFFDIDKVILAYIGFSLGYLLVSIFCKYFIIRSTASNS